MKTIYLRVQVPDHINPETVDIGYISHDNFNDYRAEFTEIQLPSEEEKLSAASEKYPIIKDLSIAFHGAFCEGATWLLNKMIGAGAVVVKDITEPGTYVGNPAKIMKK